MHNKKILITGVVALIVGAGVGYFGATAFAAPAKTGAAAFAARGGAAGFTGTRIGTTATGAGLLTGTIAAVSSGSVTLNTRDGSSHVVLTTPDTMVSKSVSGSLTDVTVGSTVIISGTTNSDGSVSATLIQLRPAMPSSTTPTSTTGQ